jgi:hypothetical protein
MDRRRGKIYSNLSIGLSTSFGCRGLLFSSRVAVWLQSSIWRKMEPKLLDLQLYSM